MIRLSELKLPLAQAEAPDAPLRAAACQTLGVAPNALDQLTVFKRSFDARKADLLAVFIVDVTLADPTQDTALLARLADRPHIGPTPDMA